MYPGYGFDTCGYNQCFSYAYPVGGCGGGFRGGFALIVVLFILLIIIGASYCR